MSQFQPRSERFDIFYEVLDEIGRGQYAVVRRCVNKETGNEFAAKFVRKRRKGKDCRAEVWHEVEVLQETNTPRQHSKLITLYEVFETRTELILVLELALGGDLHRHCVAIDSENPACRSEREVVFLLRQILEGVQHLHECDYIHLDLKPNNILLMTDDASPEIKIIDFGLAKKIKKGEQICLMVGTPEFVAPEILEFEPVGMPSDIWSIGVIAYVMLTGTSPFAGDDKHETSYNVSLANVDFPEDIFQNISCTAQDFITTLLQKSPEDRPTVSECLRHPWLETEELVHKSPTRKTRRPSRRESNSSDLNKSNKKPLPLHSRIKDRNNNLTVGLINGLVNGET